MQGIHRSPYDSPHKGQVMRKTFSWHGVTVVNSSPPSPAYMRQETGSALVQVMACRLTAPSHYLNQYWLIVNWTLMNKFQWYFNRHSIIFIDENAFKNVVCDFSAKLSRGRWVKLHMYCDPPAVSIYRNTNPTTAVVQIRASSVWKGPRAIKDICIQRRR